VGRFFATVNVSACALQCFVLPHILSQRTLPHVLLYLPLIVFLAVLLGVFNPGIISVMLGFGTIKVLEYSVMTAASEMIYMPMDRDVRYLGKELIKFFGHKLGKSTASLILSFFIARLDPSLSTQSVWGAVFTGLWTVTMLVGI
jgi:ATP/ADP translocase